MQQRRKKPNARKRAHVPARRSRHMIPTIDIHAHFVPEEYLRLIEAEGGPYGVSLRPGPNGPMIVVGRATIGPITAHYHDLELRLKAMDAQRVAVHALSLMPPMVYWADGALGLRLAKSSTTRWPRPPGPIPTASWVLRRFPCKILRRLSPKWNALSQSSAAAASISARMFGEKS